MTTNSSLVVSLAHLLVSGVSVFLVAQFLPGIRIRSFFSAVVFAFVVAILNTIAWHWLALLTVPFSFLTLGIGALVINGVLFLMAGSVAGIEISGCVTAAIASLAVTLVNGVLRWILDSFLLHGIKSSFL